MYIFVLGPLPHHRGHGPIDGVPPIGLGTFRPLPYPIKLGDNPAYLNLGRCKDGPGNPRILPEPIQILTRIIDLVVDPYGGLVPGIALSLPRLS